MDGVVGGRKTLEEYANMQERLIRRLKDTLKRLKRDESIERRSKSELLFGTQAQPFVTGIPWNPRSKSSSIAVVEDALMLISNKMRILPYPWRTYGDAPKKGGKKGSSEESLVAQMSSSKRIISVSSLASYVSSTFDLKNPQRSDTLLRLPTTIKPSIKAIPVEVKPDDSTQHLDPAKKKEIKNWTKKIKSQMSNHGAKVAGTGLKVTKHTSPQQTKVKSNLTQALQQNHHKNKEAKKKESFFVTKPSRFNSQNATKNINSVVFPIPEETKKKHKDPFPVWWQRDLPSSYGILKKIQNDAKKMCSIRNGVSLPKVQVERVQSAQPKENLNSDQLLSLINGIYKVHRMVSQDETESVNGFGIKSKDQHKVQNFLRDLSTVLEKFVNGKDESDFSADNRNENHNKKSLKKKKHHCRPTTAEHAGDRDETHSHHRRKIFHKAQKQKSELDSVSWKTSTRLDNPTAFRWNQETNGEATKTSRRPTPVKQSQQHPEKPPPYQNIPVPPLIPRKSQLQRNFQMIEVSKIDIDLSQVGRSKEKHKKKYRKKHGSRHEFKSWEADELKLITKPKKPPPPPSTSKEENI